MRSKLLSTAVIAGLALTMSVAGSVSLPSTSQAETRLTVGGAGPLYYPRLINELPLGRLYLLGTDEERGEPLTVLEGYDLLNHMIGGNWFPGSTPQVVNYPASMSLLSGSLSAPTVDDGVAMGRASLDEQIKTAAAKGDPVEIAGLSEGTLVINRELAYLATDPSAPRDDLLSFVLFSGPEIGLFKTYLPVGTTLPLVDYTAQNLADSQYDVDVVFHQYDAWADPPDRPWNLLSVVNSLAGTLYFHTNAALAAPSDAIEISRRTSDLGGTTTTYMLPSSTVPILKPLQQLGVPTEIVDALNSTLKPIVDAGYSRLTPDAGPYFSHGHLHGSPKNEPASDITGDDDVAKADSDTIDNAARTPAGNGQVDASDPGRDGSVEHGSSTKTGDKTASPSANRQPQSGSTTDSSKSGTDDASSDSTSG